MSISISQRAKSIITFIKTFFILIIFFTSFSVLSSLIPDKAVRNNIEKSMKYVENQPDYPHMMIYGDHHRLDYAMDGMITNIIYTIDNEELLKSAFLGRCRMNEDPNTTHWKHVVYNIENKNLKPNVNYARYWHGNSFFFRILYWITHYNELKWIIYILTSVLIVLFAILLHRETGTLKAMALLLGLFFVNIYVMQFSMQMSPVLIISIISSFYLVKNLKVGGKKTGLLFFITGSVTAYFDLLTAPVLTLGIPMLLWVELQNEDDSTQKQLISGFKNLVGFGLLWLTGYVASWTMKIIITIPFAEFDIISDVLNQFKLRSGTLGLSRISAIEANFNLLPLVFINILLIIPVILSIFYFRKKGISKAILFLLVAAMPYLWYFGAADHSYFHNWFTYRVQAVSISGVFLAAISLVNRVKLLEHYHKIFRIKI
ncbi:MAG: hypothetical protein K0B15_00060 [Lentimicrobium sp.]|nr:hypothetical protein [Lentimicrobium sp.]